MRIIYAQQPLDDLSPPSLFLAGPTPRAHPVTGVRPVDSWRPEAVVILSGFGYDGTLLVPEDDTGGLHGDKVVQLLWETRALTEATAIAFWVPRDLVLLPGFTTNVEFGRWMESRKVVLGFPPGAPKTTTLLFHADRLGIPVAHTLHETLSLAMDLIERRS